MINSDDVVLLGHRYIHDKTGKDYAVTTIGRMKFDGVWHDCIVYIPIYKSNRDCFVRTVDDFKANFTHAEDIIEL